MLVVGITGGIATGKSTVTMLLRSFGYHVLDSDIIAKEIQNTSEILEEIKLAFPEAFVNDVLDRKLLGKIVFSNANKRTILNNIIHPKVKAEIKTQIKELNQDIIFVDVPLLYEAQFEDLFDYIIVVHTKIDTQIKRLMERDNISNDYAKVIISSQMLLEEKIKLADYLIDNNFNLEYTKQQLLEIIDLISKKG